MERDDQLFCNQRNNIISLCDSYKLTVMSCKKGWDTMHFHLAALTEKTNPIKCLQQSWTFWPGIFTCHHTTLLPTFHSLLSTTTMRLAIYSGVSSLLALGVILNAMHQRSNFYAACLYLAKSSACIMVRVLQDRQALYPYHSLFTWIDIA